MILKILSNTQIIWMIFIKIFKNTIQIKKEKILIAFFFSIWVFFHDHSQFTGLQGKGEGIFF